VRIRLRIRNTERNYYHMYRAVPGEAAGKGEEGAGAASAGDGDSGAAAAIDAAGTLSLLPPVGVPRPAPDPPRVPPRPDVREGFATRGFGSGSATSKKHMTRVHTDCNSLFKLLTLLPFLPICLHKY
jgi:hypothetical protein